MLAWEFPTDTVLKAVVTQYGWNLTRCSVPVTADIALGHESRDRIAAASLR